MHGACAVGMLAVPAPIKRGLPLVSVTAGKAPLELQQDPEMGLISIHSSAHSRMFSPLGQKSRADLDTGEGARALCLWASESPALSRGHLSACRSICGFGCTWGAGGTPLSFQRHCLPSSRQPREDCLLAALHSVPTHTWKAGMDITSDCTDKAPRTQVQQDGGASQAQLLSDPKGPLS